jgi:hypothetical protein
MSDSPGAVTMLYTGLNQSGTPRLLSTASIGADGRYDRLPAKDMVQEALWQNLRSATIYTPTPGAATVIIFGSDYLFDGQAYEWRGPFLLLTANSGVEWDLNLDEFDFDKYSHAVLLVHTQRAKETRIFWSQAAAQLRTQLAGNLPPEVTFDGDPVTSWHAWTATWALAGGGALSDKRIYLTYDQHFMIAVPHWADYSARIKFWIRLRVNSDGVAVGWVQRAEYWVESGAFAKVVAMILEPNLQLAIPKLNAAITTALAPINAAGTLTGIYFLPGRSPPAAFPGAVEADTNVRDVTIVFEGV